MKLAPQIPVAIFMTRFEPGGTERQMTELIRRLDRRRFRAHVACFHKSGAWLPRIEPHAASVTEFPIRGFARPAAAVQLLAFARWCRHERIAVVQTCDLYANIFALPGAALAGVPVRIGSRREINPDKSPQQIRLQRLAYRCATKVVANSPAAERRLQEEGLAPGSIAVVANGLDPAAFSEREALDRVRTITTVANLRPEKNHETLIAAAATLVRDYPHLRFRIVGDGPRRRQLESLVRQRGLTSAFEFLGHRDDVPALLATSDVFVLPSRCEAFPNGTMEAMAAGLPVVVSAVGGLLDLVDDGRTGLLVPPSEPDTLANALRALIDNPARAHALGCAARREVRQRYSFDRMIAAFEDLYLSGLPAQASARAEQAPAAGL